MEPGLNPALKAAVWVPDATMDAMRLPLRFFATARQGGARLRPFTEVTSLLHAGRRVTGVAVRDHLTGREAELGADLVVNATGPWCERLAAMAGAAVPVQPSPGVLLALAGRLCNLVVNRLHAAADGDIVLPQRALSIVGTSAWTVEDPDDLEVPDEHVQAMYREGAKLVPAVASAAERAAWSAARPLIGASGGQARRPRAVPDLQVLRPRRHRRGRGVRHHHRRQGHHPAGHGRGHRRPGLRQVRPRGPLPHP